MMLPWMNSTMNPMRQASPHMGVKLRGGPLVDIVSVGTNFEVAPYQNAFAYGKVQAGATRITRGVLPVKSAATPCKWV